MPMGVDSGDSYKIEDNVVIENRTVEKNGYNACVLVLLTRRRVKPLSHMQVSLKMFMIRRTLVESRFQPRGSRRRCSWVDRLKMSCLSMWLEPLKEKDSKGVSVTVLREDPTHGSKFHRGIGGTAMSAPLPELKGTRMPGRMGTDRVTVQNLEL